MKDPTEHTMVSADNIQRNQSTGKATEENVLKIPCPGWDVHNWTFGLMQMVGVEPVKCSKCGLTKKEAFDKLQKCNLG